MFCGVARNIEDIFQFLSILGHNCYGNYIFTNFKIYRPRSVSAGKLAACFCITKVHGSPCVAFFGSNGYNVNCIGNVQFIFPFTPGEVIF